MEVKQEENVEERKRKQEEEEKRKQEEEGKRICVVVLRKEDADNLVKIYVININF